MNPAPNAALELPGIWIGRCPGCGQIRAAQAHRPDDSVALAVGRMHLNGLEVSRVFEPTVSVPLGDCACAKAPENDSTDGTEVNP